MSTLTHEQRLFVEMRPQVERRNNVVQRFHQAHRMLRHPVLRQDRPWEKHSGMCASVIRGEEEGVFKAWYLAGGYLPGHSHVYCYAVSEDGIHWEKPILGLHEALGTRENNIVIPVEYHDGMDHWETVLKDTMDPDASRRYKALGWSSYDWDGPMCGIYSATSPDGLNWSHTPKPLFHRIAQPGTDAFGPIGDAQSMMVDTRKQRYVAFLRSADGISRCLSISEDFVHWTRPQPFLQALNEEETLYNNTGFPYGDMYLGFLTHFNRNAYEQTQTLQLITSRDGKRWMRPFADPFIPLGGVGEWDRCQILLTGAPPIRLGDQLYIYYRGASRRHNKVVGEFEPRIDADQLGRSEGLPYASYMAIGLATIRVDGFASVEASFDGGWIQTRELDFGGQELSVNVVSDHGRLMVEVLDGRNDEPIRGYTLAECIPIETDSTDVRVRWKKHNSVTALAGRPVKIRFHLWNARLYSYRCV